MEMVMKDTFIDEMEWNGWNGVGWNGVEWNENEMEWDGNEVKWKWERKRVFFLENIVSGVPDFHSTFSV